MANGTQSCDLKQFERNNYFFGKLMTVRDFQVEQSYFMEKARLLSHLVHGAGILCGLSVTDPRFENDTLMIELTKGTAIDCCGRKIVVSAPGPIEVKEEYQEGTNYIYIKYCEYLKDQVPSATNASSCEEICCYSRIVESYEVFISSDPPVVTNATFSGTITYDAGGAAPIPISGAKIEALQSGIVKFTSFTNNDGEYVLPVVAGTYTVRISARGFNEENIAGIAILENDNQVYNRALILNSDAEKPDPSSYCKEISNSYYEERLQTCPVCDDPKVLLAVVNISSNDSFGRTVEIDTDETKKYRSIIFNNQMLYTLLCEHMADLNNPHYTNAAQVGALKSINQVESPGGNVQLTSDDGSLNFAPDPTGKTINITFAHADPFGEIKSINGVESPGGNVQLISSNRSVIITPNTNTKTIDLTTTLFPGWGIHRASPFFRQYDNFPNWTNNDQGARVSPEQDQAIGLIEFIAPTGSPITELRIFGSCEDETITITLFSRKTEAPYPYVWFHEFVITGGQPFAHFLSIESLISEDLDGTNLLIRADGKPGQDVETIINCFEITYEESNGEEYEKES